MLRARARQDIVNAIESSYFGVANFIIQFGDGIPVVVDISFIPDRRFNFQIKRATGTNQKPFHFTEAPGEKFLTAQIFSYDDVTVAAPRISRWIERIREELISANLFSREVAELRAHLEERLAQLDQDFDGFFTQEEASALTNRLDELAAKLSELQAKNDQLELDVSQLETAINDLKDATTLVNKGTWFRMTSGRLLSGLKALTSSQEAREFALEAAKKFLLEGPK